MGDNNNKNALVEIALYYVGSMILLPFVFVGSFLYHLSGKHLVPELCFYAPFLYACYFLYSHTANLFCFGNDVGTVIYGYIVISTVAVILRLHKDGFKETFDKLSKSDKSGSDQYYDWGEGG